MDFEKRDLDAIKAHGKTPEQVSEELEMLKNGFPFLEIVSPATIGKGIFALTPQIAETSRNLWMEYLFSGKQIVKFVPASGAASRMFKELQSFMNSKVDHPGSDTLRKFFNEIRKFAFFRRLNLACITFYERNVEDLINEGRYKDIIRALLRPGGLNYARQPKLMIMFHKIVGSTRTALEEHLAEAAQMAVNKHGETFVHFTISPEHRAVVESKLREVKYLIEHRYGVKINVSLSEQKSSTDTIAATSEGTPFRVNGELFFRPGGHGALIENLNDIEADIVFIKNVDNILPDSKRVTSNQHKMILGGICVGLKQRIDKYLTQLDAGTPTKEKLAEMLEFLRTKLCITNEDAETMTQKQLAGYIYKKLNRPLRVCGMVKNEGEPGGGPFMVYDPIDETIAPQILELSQIDTTDGHERRLLAKATHFNPVDLVCAIKDYKGHRFNLPDYVNKMTGFVSHKSKDGVDLIALELPGLWNGAMSDWNTVFIEVPAETFNPVKEVIDLLRPAHQISDDISSRM